ncbi:MAG: nif11-like peptide radical SAM maturase [Dehalobacterium sp.]
MPRKEILPFHLFNHHGNHYVINIEKMCTSSVDEITAQALKMIVTEPEMLLTSDIEEALQKLGLFSQEEESKKAVQKDSFPIINLSLFLTQSCNLNCIYCYGDGGGYGTGGSMDEKTAFQAVDWLIQQSGKMKKIHLGFFGGEPFLEFPLMKAVVEYAERRTGEVDKKVDFHCTTNATLLNDEQIAFIKDHNIAIMISIDGPREVHDAQRPYANGQGSYESIIPKIKKLLVEAPETPGHAVIVGDTDPQMVKNALREIGFKKITMMPASQSLFNEEPDKSKEERETRKFLQVLEQEAESWIQLIQSRDDQSLEDLKSRSGLYHGLISLLHHSKIHYACGAGLGMVAASVTGDVYLCHRFVGIDNYKIGNVFEKDLKREKYLKSPVTHNEKCAACFARYYCAGGCKHDNVGSRGCIATPSEEICRLRCRELELASSIICRLTPGDQAFLLERGIFPLKPCPLDF